VISARREPRQLKHCSVDEGRVVPSPRPGVDRDPARAPGQARHHIGQSPVPRCARCPLSESLYGRLWPRARAVALNTDEIGSPLARRPYDLRHAAVSTWLNSGVPAPQVAAWADHSVDVLLRVFAKCIAGQDDAVRRRAEDALRDQDQSVHGP